MGKATIRGWLPPQEGNTVEVTIIPGKMLGGPRADEPKLYQFSRIGLYCALGLNVVSFLAFAVMCGMSIYAMLFKPSRGDDIGVLLLCLLFFGGFGWMSFSATRALLSEIRRPIHEVAIFADRVSVRVFTGMRIAEHVVPYEEISAVLHSPGIASLFFEAKTGFPGCPGVLGRVPKNYTLRACKYGFGLGYGQMISGLKTAQMDEILRDITQRAPGIQVKPYSSATRVTLKLFGG